MSGGHFDYNQHKIGQIADDIEHLIESNDSKELDEWGSPKSYGFRPDTIEEFKQAVMALRLAQVYAHRVDWLVSADDGEDSFHRSLAKELAALRARSE